jgi:hypothetical protein
MLFKWNFVNIATVLGLAALIIIVANAERIVLFIKGVSRKEKDSRNV